MTRDEPASDQSDVDTDVDAFTAFEAAGWERQAPTYDDVIGRVTSRLVGPLLEAAGVQQGSRVLDLATGPGYAAAEAAALGASVVGVDAAPAMVELARRLHPTVEFRVAQAEALPFENDVFDAVVSNFVAPHLSRPERAVSELVRVLRSGGRVTLTTWDAADRMRFLGVFLDAFAEAGATPPPNIPAGPAFFQFADDEKFAHLLTGCGLSGVEVTKIAFDHRVESGEELWQGMLGGMVRTSATFLGQSQPTREKIRTAFDKLVLNYRRGEWFEVPVSVKLASGVK
jgi:SAM-dependent methyltransferase